jgi:hypothetical protein
MGAGLAPGVGQLNAGHGALGSDKARDALQRGDLFVVPQAQVFGGDTALGGDGGGFGEYQPGTADGTAAEVDQVPVVGQAIDAGVLAHRRHGNAVEQGQLAQGIRFEQLTHGAPLLGFLGTSVGTSLLAKVSWAPRLSRIDALPLRFRGQARAYTTVLRA